jgi:hypothetical protein
LLRAKEKGAKIEEQAGDLEKDEDQRRSQLHIVFRVWFV